MAEKGHWYTDKNGNHYFVGEGQTPKEGWEQSKRRKMIDGGEYKVDDGDGKGPRSVSKDEYDKYEADGADFDENIEDDFGFDEEESLETTESTDQEHLTVKIPAGSLGDNPDLQSIASKYWVAIEQNDDGSYSVAGYPDEIAEFKKDYYPDESGNDGQSEDDFSIKQGSQGTYEVFHKDRSGGPVAEFDSEEDAREQVGKWKSDPEGFKKEFDIKDADYGRTGLNQGELASQFELSDEEAEDFADFLYNKGLRDGDENKAIDYYQEWRGNKTNTNKTDAKKIKEYASFGDWFKEYTGRDFTDAEEEKLKQALSEQEEWRAGPSRKKPGSAGGGFTREFPDDKEKTPHFIGPDGDRYDSEEDYWQSKKQEEKNPAATAEEEGARIAKMIKEKGQDDPEVRKAIEKWFDQFGDSEYGKHLRKK